MSGTYRDVGTTCLASPLILGKGDSLGWEPRGEMGTSSKTGEPVLSFRQSIPQTRAQRKQSNELKSPKDILHIP